MVFDQDGNVLAREYREINQIYPNPGWLEQDPMEYLHSVEECIQAVLAACGPDVAIEGIGITNQRETTVVWDAETGEPVHNAIVWQCRRTAPFCDDLRRGAGRRASGRRPAWSSTPTSPAPRSSGFWTTSPARGRRPSRGRLRFGTIDAWLIWNLTGGRVHATDYSNASRTMLFNIHTRRGTRRSWPNSASRGRCCPRPSPSSHVYGETASTGARRRPSPSPAWRATSRRRSSGRPASSPA